MYMYYKMSWMEMSSKRRKRWIEVRSNLSSRTRVSWALSRKSRPFSPKYAETYIEEWGHIYSSMRGHITVWEHIYCIMRIQNSSMRTETPAIYQYDETERHTHQSCVGTYVEVPAPRQCVCVCSNVMHAVPFLIIADLAHKHWNMGSHPCKCILFVCRGRVYVCMQM